MAIKKFIAQFMAFCLVLTTIMPHVAVAASETDVSHSVVLKSSEHGKLSFYPVTETSENEEKSSFEPGSDVMLSVAPEEGYVVSDISINSDGAEVEASLFPVEEDKNVIGLSSIDKDLEISATFEQGELQEEETPASGLSLNPWINSKIPFPAGDASP